MYFLVEVRGLGGGWETAVHLEEVAAEEGEVVAAGESVEVEGVEVPVRADAGQQLLRLLDLKQIQVRLLVISKLESTAEDDFLNQHWFSPRQQD